jgi:hypothetical protein
MAPRLKDTFLIAATRRNSLRGARWIGAGRQPLGLYFAKLRRGLLFRRMYKRSRHTVAMLINLQP